LGFWAALGKEFPETKWQRCWVHKTANVLDKLPKGLQGKTKSMIHDMYMADTKENALKAYRHFLDVYSAKYPKTVECLQKDEAPPVSDRRDVFGCCETTSISLLFAYGRNIHLLPPVQLYYVRPLFTTAASAWPRQRPTGEFLPAP
jgi:hypothetical protein